jgi:hypothetical protein
MSGWPCPAHGCGLVFGSLSAFEGHRVGRHAYTLSEGLRMKPPREDGRRCLAEWELTAAGWARDCRGHWRTPSRAVRAAMREVQKDAGRDESPSGEQRPIPGLEEAAAA